LNDNTEAWVTVLSIILQALGGLALIPILSQQAIAMARFWKEETDSVNATRVMIVTWCASLLWVAAWRVFSWWYMLVHDGDAPYSVWGGFSVSFVIFVSAATSLIAFLKRQQYIDGQIRAKLQQAGLQHERRDRAESIDSALIHESSIGQEDKSGAATSDRSD
jgi:hypothetical protein